MSKDKESNNRDLRARLLDAVDEILNERGVGAVSLREAARRANVSHAAPAHHFGNKAGLLTAYVAQGFERLAAHILEHVANRSPCDGAEMVGEIGRGYISFALRHRQQFELMFRGEHLESDDPALQRAMDLAFNVLRSTMHRCVEEGSVAREEADVLTVSAWSLAHGFATLHLSGRLEGRVAGSTGLSMADKLCTWFTQQLQPEPSTKRTKEPERKTAPGKKTRS